MNQSKKLTAIMALLVIFIALAACSTGPVNEPVELVNDNSAPASNQSSPVEATSQADSRPAGWTDATHINKVDPDYDVVFPQVKVNQMTITIDPADWAAMQANMTELMGPQGQQGMAGAPNMPGNRRPPGGEPGDFPGGFPGGEPGGFPGGFLGGFTSENPMWVPATIEFEGLTWTNVGVRYKGNSSLRSAWSSGSLKIPLKLDFDEFEDDIPEIHNQRFYGFKQLSLANGFSDDTFMRDRLTYDLLAKAGLTAARTAYYEIILDYGEGPVSLGLYVMIEVIDDTVVERTFGHEDGNIYDADGAAATFAAGTFNQIETSFQKENNRSAADWSDLEQLYQVLHSDQRTSEPAAWRADLEAIFDVDAFLEWLAMRAVLLHWDSYGAMSHNYYLYNNPDTGQITWISWDHNMVLLLGSPGGNLPDSAVMPGGPGGRGAGGGMGRNVSFDGSPSLIVQSLERSVWAIKHKT